MFKVFKIDIFHKEIIFSSILMSGISYTLRMDYNVAGLDVAIQIILMFLLVWMLFRIHIFYALIMTLITYQAYMLIQTLYYYALGYNSHGFFSIYFLQIMSALTAILIGLYVTKKRKGFDFVPDSPTSKVVIKTREKILFILMLPSIFVMTSTIYITEHLSEIYIIIPFIHAAILFGYVFHSYKKDRSE